MLNAVPAIRVLDAVTIGQIAAGEVIERPLSVVKELVENALDAGATRIAVRVRGGGIGSIEVADNGSGIAPADLPLAVVRHGTSKLADANGLTRIGTLGFRGEGLASIAAVARLTLVSRTAGDEVATSIEACGETIGALEPVAAPPGTRATVRDLFAAVPARREYLRSPAAEFARIAQWLATVALAYPDVGFSLDHDGRGVFAFAANDDLRVRLAHVFGPGGRTMLALSPSAGSPHVAVAGYVSSPGDDRPDRRAQVLFVNGRLLRSTLLAGAWSAAYRTFAMVGRHPYGVLLLRVPPAEVDPNVHPTKSDVRLRYGERVTAAVRDALTTALRRGASERFERAFSAAPPEFAALPRDGEPTASSVEWSEPLVDLAAVTPLRVLAQLDRTYILASDGRALVLVDQHAAHERVVYERLLANAAAHAPAEPLLVPFTFEATAEQARALEAAAPALAAAGLVIEPFGERAYRIVATPAHATHAGQLRIFAVADFLDCLDDEGARGLDPAQRVWASLACHSVARAGDRLAFDEMTTLLERLQRCENPMHCPHGRPTIVRLEPDALARLFKRL